MSQDYPSSHKRRRALMPDPAGQRCPCEGPPSCGKCQAGGCVRIMWSKAHAELDHVLLRALHGIDGPVRWLCPPCNASRGAIAGNRMRGARRAALKAIVQAPRPSREW